MFSSTLSTTLAALAFLSFMNSLNAREIHVSTRGDDAAPGTLHRPLRTIQAAVDRAGSDDDVVIHAGVYREAVVVRSKAGRAEDPFIIRGLGEVLVTSGEDLRLGDPNERDDYSELPLSDPNHPYHPYYLGGLFRIHQSEHVIIDGIDVRQSSWMGFSARYCRHLTIRNCRSFDTMASGIYILDSEVVDVHHNEIVRACGKTTRIGEHGSQECLSIVNTRHFEVRYNIVRESGTWEHSEDGGSGVGGEGIDVKENSHHGSVHHNYVYNLSRLGIYCDAWASDLSDVSFHHNVVHDCKHGIALACEAGGTLRDIRVHNNLLYNLPRLGIALSSWGMSGSKQRIQIANNTLYRCLDKGIDLGTKLHAEIEVVNNLIWNPEGDEAVAVDPGAAREVHLSNNLVDRDPQFVAPARGDFRLAPGSPAIDAGAPVDAPETDLNGETRIRGEAIDLGAFEHQPTP